MRLSHTLARTSAAFDDPNLVSHAGLVPVMALAGRAGLHDLAAEHVRPAGDCGANPDLKVGCLVAGMAAGADSIDDMGLLRHGAMGTLFAGVRAPSTLGSFLRSFTWGNVRQAEKTSREFLARLSRQAPLLPGRRRAGLRRHRLHPEARLRAQEAGREVRPHQDPGQVAAGPGPERAGRDGQHPAVGAGDRRRPAARRERRLRPRRGQPGRRGRRHRPGLRRDRHDRRPDGLRVLRRRHDRRGPPGRRPVLRHRPGERQRPRRHRRHPRGRVEGDPLPARRSGTTSWAAGSPTPRSPRRLTRRSPRNARTCRSPPGSSSAASATSTRRPPPGRASCSPPGATTPSSPTPRSSWSRPSPSTAATRSSSRSSPTGTTGRSRTSRPGVSPRTPPGWSSRRWPSTWSAPRAPSPSLPFAKARAATIRAALITVAARTARHGRGHLTLHLPQGWHREREWLNLWEAACGPPATAA